MSPAQFLVKSVDILARNERVATPRDFGFRASSTQVTFPGFLKVHGVEEGDEDKMAEEGAEAIPPLTAAEALELLGLNPEQHFTEPPPRYSEATLIKILEELGIGRPSTYAPTISTIQKREYVEKDKGRLKPTPLGETTTDLLVKWFPVLLDVQFTAQMEEQLDEVESGKIEWHEPPLDGGRIAEVVLGLFNRAVASRWAHFIGLLTAGLPLCRHQPPAR